MGISTGGSKIEKLYLGGAECKKAYVGETLVFGGGGGKPSRLPEGYTEVEYIQSDSKSYVQTDVAMNLRTGRLVMDIEPEDYLTGNEYIFMAPLPSTLYSYSLYLYRRSSPSYPLRYKIGKDKEYMTSWDIANNRQIVDLNFPEKRMAVGTHWVSIYQEDVTMATTIRLFNAASIVAKLYSAQIYISSAIKADFVPCMDSSGAVGLYDLVSAKFYTNAGTGKFTAGPAV